MKKNKKYLIQGFLFIFVLPLVIFTSTANAYEGSRNSATQKEWFSVFYGCARQPLAYKIDSNIFSGDFWSNLNANFLLSPGNAKSGNWFEGAKVLTPYKNPYVEAQVEGSYGDGKFYCGQKDNVLTKRTAKSIGFENSYEEIICSGDNFKEPGLLAYNVDGTCHGAYIASDSSGTYFINVNSSQHLVDFANEKIDSGNFGVKELSSLERYFVLHDAFKYACVKNASPLEYAQTKTELEGTYPYVIYEEHDGVAEYAGYNEAGNMEKTTYVTYFYDEGAQCQDIAAQLSEKNTDLDEYLADGGGTSEDASAEDACYEKAGLDSVSYIVCPAINNTTSVVDTIEDVLRTLLEINPNNTFSSETYEAWNIFRNIANIFLIIILLIIIFSQLTGYGIDNYGIKKMLPRLIAMAIVINLSYVICELAVDISNILGSGLYELFKGIGMTVNADAAGQDTATIVGGILGALGGASVPVAGAVVAGIAAGGGVMIVISLVLLLLVALVAVVLVFLMLGVRMAIIILFVAISPVAFALYILPNTQNIFKKYWKIAEAALVVFPICGAVCGASFIIRAILLSNSIDGVIPVVSALVAICMPFLPFFLLPSLLRNVIGGLGAIGGVLSGIGNNIRRGTQSLGDTVKTGVRNSEGFKNAANRRAENRQFRWAERHRNSSNAATRRKAQTLLNERTQQRAQDNVGVMDLDPDTARMRAVAARNAQEYKAAQDQYASYGRDELLQAAGFTQDQNGRFTVAGRSNILGQPGGSQRMKALISEMESRGMESSIYSMLRQNADIGNDETVMSGLASSNNKVLKAYGKQGAGVSYENYMNGTGSNNIQGYIDSKGKDFINGVDDKALAEIARYNNGNAMSNDLLVEAAARLNDNDSLRQINAMLNNRTGTIHISGEQLANMDMNTIQNLFANPDFKSSILAASDDLSRNTELVNKMSAESKNWINQLRGARIDGGNSDPI